MFNLRIIFSGFIILISTVLVLYANENELELYPPWLETYRYVNESYKVTCKFHESFHNLTWMKPNGRVINEKNGNSKIRSQKMQHGIVLIFDSIIPDSEGPYTCMATNNGKYLSSMFTLYVAEPIVFVSPRVFEAVLSEDVFLECKVNGKFIPEKYWEFNGNILVTGEPFTYQPEGLVIPNVGLQHAGKYLCIVAHTPFQSNRNILEVTLIVYCKPMLRHGKRNDVTIYGFVNEILSLICEVTANPKVWFVWYKSGNALNPKNDNVTIVNGNNTSVLQVTLTENRTEERFSCEACNELGCVEQSFLLRTTTKLKKPTVGLWDTYSDSAKFYVSFQKDATYYLFEYFYVVRDFNWEKSFLKNFTVGMRKPELGVYMSFQLPNLQPDTKYVARVAAGNNCTMSEFSEDRGFKTRIGSSIYTICSSTNNQKYNFILQFFLLLLKLHI